MSQVAKSTFEAKFYPVNKCQVNRSKLQENHSALIGKKLEMSICISHCKVIDIQKVIV